MVKGRLLTRGTINRPALSDVPDRAGFRGIIGCVTHLENSGGRTKEGSHGITLH